MGANMATLSILPSEASRMTRLNSRSAFSSGDIEARSVFDGIPPAAGPPKGLAMGPPMGPAAAASGGTS